jgi:hypothetical protein
MMCLAGGTENQLPTTIEDFLARQVLITNPIAIELVNKIVRDKAAKAMIGRPEEEVSA